MEVFVIMIQSIFHLKSQRQRTLRLLFEDCRFIYLHSLMRSDFLPRKGLLCLYDKQNNTWLLVDMEFLFSCSTRHLTRSLRSLVSYRVKHSKINSISPIYSIFPIYYLLSIPWVILYNNDKLSVSFWCNILEWLSAFIGYHLTTFQYRTPLTPRRRFKFTVLLSTVSGIADKL